MAIAVLVGVLAVLAFSGIAVAIEGDVTEGTPAADMSTPNPYGVTAVKDDESWANDGWGTASVVYPPETGEAIEQARRDGKIIGIVVENGVARVDRVFDTPAEATAAMLMHDTRK